MSIFSRKTSINVFLLSINFVLLAIISRVVIADENTNAILEQSIYLYYYESDDALLDVGQSQLYTFAPIPGENITIVSYGLDDSALTSVSLFDSNSNLVGTGTTNQVTEKPDNTDTTPQSPFITAIEHTANSSGLYYFEVKHESGDAGLIRTMLFVGEPFNTDLTLIDELNPLLPSKAFMVAGDPDREWINELTGETIQGLRTDVDVLPIERIDRSPDVFLSYSTLSYLPDVTERLEPVTFDRWFNQDDQEIYLVNIRPVPEKETEANRAILENLNFQTYNSNNFFFFEYLFSVGNGSDPIALDRGAGACAGLSDRIDCISSDPNLGREVASAGDDTITLEATVLEGTTSIEISGEVVSVTIDRTTTCTAFNGAIGNPVTITVTGSTVPTTVCVPTSYIPATGTFTTGTFVAGNPNTCTGTVNDDAIACTSGNDIINALAGNDAIIADAGNDIIDGGDGDDFILAGSGNDTVAGGAGYDSIDGGSGNDTINLGIDGGLAIGGIGTDTFIIDDDHGTADFSVIAGGASLNSIGDGEQDTFDFNGDPNGLLILYTEGVDRLDFTDYTSGVTVDPFYISGSDLDIFTLGTAPSNISGSALADTFNLSTSTANLNIDANGGADVINTGSGADTIDGGAGADTINSGAGNDTININDGDGADTIDGGLGTDLINAISSSNPLIVTLNNAVGSIFDTVTLESDAVSNVENVNTGSGADQFFISDFDSNIINAGGGDDVATVAGGIGTIFVTRTGDNVVVSAFGIGFDQYNSVIQVNVSGSGFNDNFIVSDANDNIFNGLGGIDSIDYAPTSDDILVNFYATNTAEVSGTSIGTDTLINFEQIATDSGNDEFIFNSDVGTVTINSRTGDDIFNFDDASGTLTLIDTSGITFLDFIDYTDGVVIDLASGAQQTVSLSDLSLLVTLNGTFNNVSGSAFADNISGTTSSDTIYGGAGADQIYGEDGNDFLYGEDGSDRIDGGAGNDTINGGAGDDDIDGGTGTDLIDESSSSNPLIVTLSNITGVGSIEDTVTGEIDMVDNVENIDTGSGLDTFFIDDIDNNIINAGGGDDVATISGGSGTITVTRTGDDVDVSDSGGGIGTDEYNSVFQVNINGSAGGDIINVTDENDNIITGSGGLDTVNTTKNTAVSGTITIIRSIGTDTYNAINTVNVTGSTENDTFALTDENDNTITGGGGTDIVNVSSTSNVSGTITVIRTGSNVAVTGGLGIGNDNYNDVDQVNITAGDGDDIFNIFDALDNIFDGGAGNDTANYAPTTFGMTIILDGSSSYTITGTGVGTDILLNIENINTGSGDDNIIIQDDNDNAINGGAGNDTGTSVMDGVYSGVITIIRSPANVVTVSGSGFGTDVYTDIETVNVTSVGGDDVFRPSDPNNNTFDAGGGTDWIDYSTITGAISVVVDLSTGTATGDGNDTLIGFENISGSIGGDTLTGDGNANIIDGYTGNDIINAGGGNDTIIGGDGDDDIDGGAGTDLIDETSNTTGLVVTLSNIAGVGNIVDAGAGEIDTVDNVENIDTGSGLDTFFINDFNDNIINAGAGNDVATISGGSGIITITRTVGDVTVTDTGGGIGNDQYNSVFQVNANGSTGSDIFVVTDANDNILDGGAGTDSIDYATTNDDILVEFTSASTANVSGASIGNDTLINFEEISTDSGDDYFLFDTNVGTVTINSRDGNDVFDFDNASGVLILSDISGSTFLDFTDYTDGVVIDLASTSQQTVSLSDLSLLVTLSSGTFNNVSGSAFVDNIRGTTSIDTIYGGDSDDTIYGEDNDDFLYGGAGADTIYGGDGNDTILGGLGDDYIDGGDGTEYIDASATGNDMVVVLSNVAGVGYIQDTGTGEIDTVDNIENVDTGGGDDQFFISDSDDNTIDAGSETTADVATVTGGTGTINITRDATGVTVSDGTVGTGIGNDRYNDVELVNVSGSGSDDTFVVDDANANILDGQGGNDSVDYSGIGTAINVTIISNQATINGAGTGIDTLYNIENIETGAGDDFFDITGIVNYGLNANTGADIFDFNTNVDGSLALETSDGAHLDFQDYDTAIAINLGLTGVSQTVDAGLTINLTGTFTSISGTDFADNISGTANVDTIYGGADNDRIWGGGDNDFLFGEAGDDTIDGGAGADTIDGGAGTDTIFGGDGNDIILGGLGDDYIDGGDGIEYIDASATGNDMVVVLSNVAGVGYIQDTGTGEIDTVDNIENVDTGGGNDQFFISDSGDNTIDAGSETTADVATVTGGTGTINITRDATGVTVSDGTSGTGIGNDRYNDVELINVSGSGTDDTFVVDDANDNILDGGAGDDTISYSPLSTPITVTIVGNQASINAATGIGADTLYNIENIETGSGADFFDITGTVDYGLNSNSGADIFFFNGNVDGTLELGTTGAGTHLDFGSFTSAGINIDLSSAISQSVTGSLEIVLNGTFTSISGTTFVDNISGTTSADTIWAGAGADTINGGAGADFLYGEAGADTINGGAGNDFIRGGTGADLIDGGSDTDTFDESDSTSDFTIIMDSSSGTSSSAVEGNDTLVGIENINTGSGDDNFTLSDSGVNIIDAATGTDTVTILNANNITIVRNGAGDVVTVTDNATGVGNDIYNNVELVNVSGTAGDDVFTIDDQFDNIINGLGGTNEINYSLVTAIINVNALSTGTTIASAGIGNDTLINIQNITTGDGADTFIIEENGVDNKYDADDGIDTATYTAAGTITASVSGSGISVQVSGSDTDQLDNFETIDFVGSAGDDTFIIQDTNDNTIDGSSESSRDTYDASFATTSITVNITGTVTANGSEIGTDTLIDIEEIKTGSSDDTFIIDTSFDGDFFFDAGEATLGNIFQFTGNGTGNMNITITSSSTSTDVLDFSQFTGSGLNINLNTNTVTAGSLFVTFDNFIDDVIGSDQDDTITGNSLQNEISGGGGNDTINYSAGDDIIDGGTGDDTVNYMGAPDAITATLDGTGMSVTISGTSDTQTITNVENISGTANDDTFIINEAVSTTINAQGGTDTVDYSGLTNAINVDLSTGIGHVSGTTSSDDHTLQDVEDVIGSNFNDTIIGNSDDNTIQGGGGNDFIQGNEGNDVIDGGTGTNTVSYKDASSGVNVNLKSGSSSGGDGNDTLTNIANVSGSAFGDNISGTAGTNVIYGGGGADTIYGNEGDDEIYGEAGDDVIYGGSLNVSGTSSDDGNDTIYGGDGDDTIYGGNNNSGGGTGNNGDDTIEGGDGDDTIYGGNNNSGGGNGNDGDDILTDTDDTADDIDVIYGDNNNTGGGTGNAGSDTITTLDGDNDDTVVGDNQVDAATANDPAIDIIVPDVAPPDTVDTGDGT